MLVYKCQCGDQRMYTSVGVPPCSKCTNCGSGFAPLGCEVTEAPEDHVFVIRYNELSGVPYEICQRCGDERACS